jgi:FkbM family methyltransferase
MRIKNAAWKIAPDGSGHKYPAEVPFRLRLMRMVGRQRWIPRGQHWLLAKLWDPDSEKSFIFEVDFFGTRYQGDLAQFLDWKVFGYGCASYCELSLLKTLANEIRSRNGEVMFFDVGANIGHHTLFMARNADRVVSFEPFAENRKLIEQKIAMNALTNVKLLPYALGAKDEALKYYPGGAINSGTGTFMPEEIGTYQNPIEIDVRNGDAVCAAHHLPRIDLLKVDVEGFEPFVFLGLSQRIRKDRPPILTELSDRSREGFGSESGFREMFWEGAVYAEVQGREGHDYTLTPFRYATAAEVLIAPPEWADFINSRMRH